MLRIFQTDSLLYPPPQRIHRAKSLPVPNGLKGLSLGFTFIVRSLNLINSNFLTLRIFQTDSPSYPPPQRYQLKKLSLGSTLRLGPLNLVNSNFLTLRIFQTHSPLYPPPHRIDCANLESQLNQLSLGCTFLFRVLSSSKS